MNKILLFFFLTVSSFPLMSQKMFDPPVTLYYDETSYIYNGKYRESWGSQYYLFQFELPCNRTLYKVSSDGVPESNGGYIYTGSENGYDKYTRFYNSFNYRIGRYQSRLDYGSYILVSSDRKIIKDYTISGMVFNFEKGDPKNPRKKPANYNSTAPTSSYNYPSTSYPSKSENEVQRRTITCSYCNGTGLKFKSLHCHVDCKWGHCNICGDRHCLDHGRHENCIDCGGTGKINQVYSGGSWRREWK